MADKREPRNVQKLAADAAKRTAAKKAKKPPPTVAKKMRLRGGKTPAPAPQPRGKPNAVLKLISDAIARRSG